MKQKMTFFEKLFSKSLLLVASFLLIATVAFSQVTLTKDFTSSGTWTVPTGVTELTIECVGGGGAGGYVHGTGFYFCHSGAGGGGAYAKVKKTVVPGKSVSVTVGRAGQAWASSGNQIDGGDSYVTIDGSVVVKAAGGKTVKGTNTVPGAAGGSVSDCIGDVKYAGGHGGEGKESSLLTQRPGGGVVLQDLPVLVRMVPIIQVAPLQLTMVVKELIPK